MPLDRRSLFGALLAAPVVGHPVAVSAMAPLKPGHIWVQVPEKPWYDFVAAVGEMQTKWPI